MPSLKKEAGAVNTRIKFGSVTPNVSYTQPLPKLQNVLQVYILLFKYHYIIQICSVVTVV